jgi:NAD-dependent dihydropyrimidine dehydrogenase PreA subunit
MKVKRSIIKIDEELCDGCGLCIPACPEGALEIVDGKAKVVKEGFCDGLGACLGECPLGALTIEEKVTEKYDEKGVIAHLKEIAPDRLEDHLRHLREHGGVELSRRAGGMPKPEEGTLKPAEGTRQAAEGTSKPSRASQARAVAGAGAARPQCPSSRLMQWDRPEPVSQVQGRLESQLRQWPIQLHLVSPIAPYFKNADLALIADCIPFSYANFHNDFLEGNGIAIACPKLDDISGYVEKLSQIIKVGDIRSIRVVIMEVPCCSGLVHIAREALKKVGGQMPFEVVVVGIKGELLKTAAM